MAVPLIFPTHLSSSIAMVWAADTMSKLKRFKKYIWYDIGE
jgi:hypothetical protein